DLRFDDHAAGGGPLPRMDFETCPLRAIAIERVEVECVQRRGAGAGVDLRLEVSDFPVGQGDPLAPPEPRPIGTLRTAVRCGSGWWTPFSHATTVHVPNLARRGRSAATRRDDWARSPGRDD